MNLQCGLWHVHGSAQVHCMLLGNRLNFDVQLVSGPQPHKRPNLRISRVETWMWRQGSCHCPAVLGAKGNVSWQEWLGVGHSCAASKSTYCVLTLCTMPGDSKQKQVVSLPVHSRDVPAQPAAGQLPEGLKPVSAAPDDLESQMRDTDPLFDGPSPPHPHKHFSGRAPWLRAGGCPAATAGSQTSCLVQVPCAQLPSGLQLPRHATLH